MILNEAMRVAKNYVVWGDPDGDFGSFEPIKGEFKRDENIWEIVCRYTRKTNSKEAKIIIDNKYGNVLGFQLLKG